MTAPPPSDRVAFGRYLMVGRLDCYSCHSRDFAHIDIMVPERSFGYLGGGNPLKDRSGHLVYTANLRPIPPASARGPRTSSGAR